MQQQAEQTKLDSRNRRLIRTIQKIINEAEELALQL